MAHQPEIEVKIDMQHAAISRFPKARGLWWGSGARPLIFLAACAILTLIALTLPAHADCSLSSGPRRTVAKVLDGETLRLDDGSEVRLAGLVAPRGFDAQVADTEWPAAIAATKALRDLAEGKTVQLGFVGQTRRDRQDRHLAQVFVLDGEVETWAQGTLLKQGHARVSQQKDVRGCLAELLQHEQVARKEGVGLWAVAAYQARQASRPRDFERLASRFVVLSGRVAWVADGRETIALGFQPGRGRWQFRRGVVALIEARDRDVLGPLGGDAKSLEGRSVEVRGWLEQRLNRPTGNFVIDVSTAGAITLLNGIAQK